MAQEGHPDPAPPPASPGGPHHPPHSRARPSEMGLHEELAPRAAALPQSTAGVHTQLPCTRGAAQVYTRSSHVHTQLTCTRGVSRRASISSVAQERPPPQPLLGRNMKVGVGRSAQILGLRERPPSPDEASKPSVGTCPQRRGNCPRGGPGACLHPRAGRPASLGSGKAPVPSVSTDPDWAPVLCAGPSTRCAHLPCHVLGTWTEGPSPCAASSTAGTESPLWAGDPRRAERPGA